MKGAERNKDEFPWILGIKKNLSYSRRSEFSKSGILETYSFDFVIP